MDREVNIKISCHVITYNQKDYISKCIDSILMQKTKFRFEIIIGDDNSSDGTRDILLEYKNKFPETIKLNLRNTRGSGIPGKENFLTTLEMCDGEYVSICDGDDYWTDAYKLQKQVDVLDANPNFSGCFHIVSDINMRNGEITQVRPSVEHPTIYNTSYILENWNIPICSFVFRNYPIIFPDFNKDSLQGDLTICLLASLKGDIYFLKENMAVYNIHEGGVSRSVDYYNRIHTNLLSFYKSFDRFTDYKYHKNVYNGIVHFIYNIQFRHLFQYKSPFKRFYMKLILLFKILWYNRDFSLRFLKIFIGDYLIR